MSFLTDYMARPRRGYWVLTAPGFHMQGEVECYDIVTLMDRATEAAHAQAAELKVAIPDGAELEVQKHSPPKSWQTPAAESSDR